MPAAGQPSPSMGAAALTVRGTEGPCVGHKMALPRPLQRTSAVGQRLPPTLRSCGQATASSAAAVQGPRRSEASHKAFLCKPLASIRTSPSF